MRVAHYLTRGETGRYYVRLRIPADLQARFGRKVIKRSAGTTCDRAALGYALLLQQRYARAFAAIRNGSMGKELEELLSSLEGKSSLELILKDVKLPGGASFGQVEINDQNDLSLFQKLAAQHAVPVPSPTPFPSRRVVKTISEPRPVGLTLAAARDKYLVSIQGKNTAKTIVQKTRALKDLEAFVASQRKGKGKQTVMLKELTRTDFSEWFLHETARKRVITYITNRFSACADFIKWAQTAGHYPQGDNPASGHASVPKQLKKQRAKSHVYWGETRPTNTALDVRAGTVVMTPPPRAGGWGRSAGRTPRPSSVGGSGPVWTAPAWPAREPSRRRCRPSAASGAPGRRRRGRRRRRIRRVP